jgi:diguanylate cyclase (GGDEF)-like protein/PAS domain S-box-containing protein
MKGVMTATTETFGPDTPLYNSKVILSYVRFVERRCPGVNISEVLAYAGIETYQLGDEGHWFTQAQVDLFQEKLVELTGIGDIAREAGRDAASSVIVGIIRHYALSFMSPVKLCEMIGKTAGLFTRSVVWEAKNTGPRTVEITVTPRPGAREKPFQCQSRIGYLEGISELFRSSLPVVEQTECVFHGGECCRYVVKWSRPKSEARRKARNYLALSLSALSAGLFFLSTPGISAASMLVTLAVVLALSARAWRMEKDELCSAIGNLRSATEMLIEKTEVQRGQARQMQDIGHVLTRQRSIEGILREVTPALQKHFDYDRGMILLADKEKRALTVEATFGYPEELAPALRDMVFTTGPESRTFLVRCFLEQRPFLINNVDKAGDLPEFCVEFTRRTGTKAFICCPLVCADDTLGVLAVGNARTTRPLLQRDIDLLTQLGRQIGVSIRSVTARQAEEAVRESEARFRAVVEKSGEIIILTDAQGNFLYISPPVTAVSGYSPEEFLGQHRRMLIHPDDRGLVEEFGAWLRANPGETKHIVVRNRHKDGTWRWVEITSRNLLDEPGVRALVSNVRDITDRKIAEETLRESENKFKNLVEESSVGVYLIQDGVFRYVNAKFAEIHGYEASEMVERLTIVETMFPADKASPEEEARWVLGQDHCRTRQFRIVTKSGQIRHVECYATRTTYGGRLAVIGTLLDITDRKADEEALRWKTTFLEALVKSNHDGILVIDSQGRMLMENQRTADIWKIPEDVVTEKERIAHFRSMVKDPELLRQKINYHKDHPDESSRTEIELKTGTIVDTSSSPVIGEDGRRYGRIWTFRDVTELKHYWDMLVDLSTTDGLTGLANRRRFDEFLEREWRRGMREESALSLIFMDIDFFKEYNDHYGHLAGDDCLRRVAGVLGGLVQRPGDLVARYGGEEFACILPSTAQQGGAELAEKIMKSINDLNLPHATSRAARHLTLSFGVATMVPERGNSPSDLIRLADHLLYSAKKEGRNRVKCWQQRTRTGRAVQR